MAKLSKKTPEEKILARERERVHKMIVSAEAEHRRNPKRAPEGAFVSLRNVNKIYDNHVQAVYNFDLDVEPREFIVFVGPSGCGKSTTLRMIAGLEEITYGDLFIDGFYANDLQPKDRNIAMVFQSYALYPHMTVYENIAFGLKIRHESKQNIDAAVRRAAKILDLCDYLNRKPSELSGGQMQRVALGRAIVRNTKLFLMDEPLSNLDAKLRVQMRSEIVKLHNELETTTIYVTHDQTEAMTMATRIVVMNKGYIQQIGSPTEIYNEPANTFVASFVGSPAMNMFEVAYDQGVLHFTEDFSLKLDKKYIEAHNKFYKEGSLKLQEEIAEIRQTLDDSIEYEKNIKQIKKTYQSEITELEAKAKKEWEEYLIDFQKNKKESYDLLKKNYPASLIKKLEKELDEAKKCDKGEDAIKAIKDKIADVEKQRDLIYEIELDYQKNKKQGSYWVREVKNKEHNEKMKYEKHHLAYLEIQLAEKEKALSEYQEILDTNKHNVIFGIRPEDIIRIEDATSKHKLGPKLNVNVIISELLGHEYFVHFNIGEEELVSKVSGSENIKIGDKIELAFNLKGIRVFDPISTKLIK